MNEEQMKKAIQQAKANVELETTPISENFINEFLEKKIKDKKAHKTLIKRGNTNGTK